MATYTQLQAADAMRDAAQNPSGGAGLTAGIGAGMGIGNLMQQATSGAMQRGQQADSSAAAAKGMPDVMTPSEAASILKVSEEDVVAAINDGSLKAKKLGNAYRISKASLEEFLNS
jgi:excisionase family DNA binding protein